MDKVTVLTSITGKKDTLIDDQAKGSYVAYLDAPYSSSTWQIKKAFDGFEDSRRNSRVHKMLPHLYVDTEYSLWIDGNMRLTVSPAELAKRYLGEHDIALFRHMKRDCIYEEAIRCAAGKLDDPETIIEQVSRYEREGYGKHKGLYECGFILRRHTPKIIEFNNYWLSEYCRGSVRDQISFAYCADKVGLRIKAIEAPWFLDENGVDVKRSDFLKMVPHTILNPQFNG